MSVSSKTRILSLIGACALIASGAALAALSTDQLTRLKTSGLGEDVIRFMVEHDYADVDRVLKLKEAGFSDETIASVIRKDLRGAEARPAPRPAAETPAQPVAQQPVVQQPAVEEKALMQASAAVRIEEYFVRGEPIIKNSLGLTQTTVSLLAGNRLKIEWRGDVATSTLDTFLKRKTFASPFYWDLDKGDSVHSVNPKENAFVLRTGRTHPGDPSIDGARYWIVYLTADTPELEKRIRAAMGR